MVNDLCVILFCVVALMWMTDYSRRPRRDEWSKGPEDL